jgi:hypothetical protein
MRVKQIGAQFCAVRETRMKRRAPCGVNEVGIAPDAAGVVRAGGECCRSFTGLQAKVIQPNGPKERRLKPTASKTNQTTRAEKKTKSPTGICIK